MLRAPASGVPRVWGLQSLAMYRCHCVMIQPANRCLLVLLPPADVISTVEFNHTGELLATGDKGGRVVIFQREPEVCVWRGHKGGRKRMGRWLEVEVGVERN